jgi:hypothetical protein
MLSQFDLAREFRLHRADLLHDHRGKLRVGRLLELGATGDAGPQDIGVVQRLPYDGARRVDPVFTGHIHAGFPP